jgi:hypothetical protein
VASGLVALSGCHKAAPTVVSRDGGVPDSGVPGVVIPRGCFAITPQHIEFGNVVVNTTTTQSFSTTNNCGFDLTMEVGPLKGTDPLLFRSIPSGGAALVLHDKETQTFTVQYTPLVASPEQNEAYFALTLCNGGTTCEPLVSLRGTAVASGVTVDPWMLDFCFVPPGQPSSMFVTFANMANASIHLTADPMVWNTDTTGGMSAAGAFQPGVGFPDKDTQIPPYASIQLGVTFTPPSAGRFTGEIDISTDDSNQSNIRLPLSGYGGGAKISCAPPALDFGATATGTSATLKVTCTNIGTDVPGHPEANLFIPAQSSSVPGLLIQNGTAAFQAAFDPVFPPAGLAAGESATIDVTYGPTVSGADADTLIISSNDCTHPAVSVQLSASAAVLPACDFQINPASGIAFGHVDEGSTAALPFVITNNGTTDCLASAFQIAPGSNPAFSLPDYPAGSGPASTTIPAGASLEVRVQFAPTTAQASFAGAVSFTISNPQTPHQSVSLTGSSLTGCLLIEPTNLDFGLVGFDDVSGSWCKSGRQTVTLHNLCANEDLNVNSITVVDLAATPEFILTGDPSPVTIPRTCVGASCPPVVPMTFQVSFEPYASGKHAGGVEIRTSDSVVSAPYLLSLSGDADQNTAQVDQFSVHAPEVDLLWVVDTDDDAEAQQAIIGDLSNFLSYPLQNGIDLNMATTSTDVYGTASSEDGRMEPCPGCKVDGPAVHVVSSSVGLPDAVSALARLLNLGAGAFCYVNCNGFASDEQFFEATYEALSPSLLGGYNQAFYRPEAFLAVIVVNGDSEDDFSDAHGLNFYYNAFIGLKGAANARKFSLSYVNNYGGIGNQRIAQMVQLTGGIEADLSNTGSPNWEEELAALWPQLSVELLAYPLSGTPEPTSIRIADNGITLPAIGQGGETNWTYQAYDNAVHFVPASAPQSGDLLQIFYTAGCSH